MNTTAIAWTIWTLNEPANYVIAACLPTLRPIFILILPASFFLLSKQTSNKRSHPSTSIRILWPRGSFRPTFRLETDTRVAKTDSRLSGPWSGTQTEAEPDAERDIGLVEKGRLHVHECGVGSNENVDIPAEKETGATETVVDVDSLRST